MESSYSCKNMRAWKLPLLVFWLYLRFLLNILHFPLLIEMFLWKHHSSRAIYSGFRHFLSIENLLKSHVSNKYRRRALSTFHLKLIYYPVHRPWRSLKHHSTMKIWWQTLNGPGETIIRCIWFSSRKPLLSDQQMMCRFRWGFVLSLGESWESKSLYPGFHVTGISL